jgi:putative Mg2+ transporter-C (MgtC) family protein
MQQIVDDITQPTELAFAVIAFRLVGAILMGAVIGFEREYRNHPAGLRTHILVSLAAAVFAVISIEVVHMHHFGEAQVRVDPLRVVEAVTSGVAFLAAGMIIFSQGQVRNLTTGAGMWLAGGVGLSVGLGYWNIAAFATFACLIVLSVLGRIEAVSIDSNRPLAQKGQEEPQTEKRGAEQKTPDRV